MWAMHAAITTSPRIPSMTCTRRDRRVSLVPHRMVHFPNTFAPRLKGIADFAKYPELRFWTDSTSSFRRLQALGCSVSANC